MIHSHLFKTEWFYPPTEQDRLPEEFR
jgi:hypothetical protein